jgi:stalled ribosome rescue protein Dom34
MKDKVVYGLRDVSEKVDSGNVSILFISENLILRMRKDNKYSVVEDLMNHAESLNAEVRMICSDEAMKKLDGITGVAAVLQWKENYS